MRRFQILLLLLLLVGGFLSCAHHHRVKKPDRLFTEQQMIEVMTDVYLVEAMLTQKKQQGEPISDLSHDCYQQLFDHYGITEDDLEENMAYYTRQPAVLEVIMDSVAHRLERASHH